jgi:hypothetical protein
MLFVLLAILLSCQKEEVFEIGQPRVRLKIGDTVITNPIGFGDNITLRIEGIGDNYQIGVYRDNRCLFPLVEESLAYGGIKEFNFQVIDGYNRFYVKMANGIVYCSQEYTYIRPTIEFTHSPQVGRIELSWEFGFPALGAKVYLREGKGQYILVDGYKYTFEDLQPGKHIVYFKIIDGNDMEKERSVEVEVL